VPVREMVRACAVLDAAGDRDRPGPQALGEKGARQVEDLRGQGSAPSSPMTNGVAPQVQGPRREHGAAREGPDQLGRGSLRVGGAERRAQPRAAGPALAEASRRQRRGRQRRRAAGDRLARAREGRGRGDPADRIQGSVVSAAQDSKPLVGAGPERSSPATPVGQFARPRGLPVGESPLLGQRRGAALPRSSARFSAESRVAARGTDLARRLSSPGVDSGRGHRAGESMKTEPATPRTGSCLVMDRLIRSIAATVRGAAEPLCACCLTELTARDHGADNVDVRVAVVHLALGEAFALGDTCRRCGAPDARRNPILRATSG
jgi:hypothetical protein